MFLYVLVKQRSWQHSFLFALLETLGVKINPSNNVSVCAQEGKRRSAAVTRSTRQIDACVCVCNENTDPWRQSEK